MHYNTAYWVVTLLDQNTPTVGLYPLAGHVVLQIICRGRQSAYNATWRTRACRNVSLKCSMSFSHES